MNMRKMVAVPVAMGALAVGVAACGGAQTSSGTSAAPTARVTPTQQTDTLAVEKTGAGGDPTLGAQFWMAGAMVHNASAKNLASGVLLQATAYGADGKVVGTGSESVNAIHAGQTLPVAISLPSISGPIARVTVQTAVQGWYPDPNPKAAVTGTNVTVGPNGGGHYLVNATLVNSLDRTLRGVRIYAVCTDVNGNINDAGTAAIALIPPSGQTGAQIFGNGPVPAACQVAGVP